MEVQLQMLYRKENYLWKNKKVELTCVNTVINRLETSSCYCWKMGHEIEDTVKFSSAANPADQLKLTSAQSSAGILPVFLLALILKVHLLITG